MAVTLKDISKETGFAVSTVSGVLNDDPRCYASEDTRRGIRRTARRLGYRPDFLARALRAKHTGLIGVAASLFGSEIIGRQMMAFTPALQERGCLPLYGDTWSEPARERHILQEMAHKQVDGIVFFPQSPLDEVRELVPKDVPCVVVHERPVEGLPCLVVDRAEATRRAVARLFELGHRRGAFCTCALRSNAVKADGFRLAFEEAGRSEAGTFIECGPEPGSIRRHIEAHAETFREITAIVASNDRQAVEAVMGLNHVGLRVPEDVSVIGFDDVDLARSVRPTLTSIRQPREEVAEASIRMLFDIMEGRRTENHVLTPQLVERESTGPAPVGVADVAP